MHTVERGNSLVPSGDEPPNDDTVILTHIDSPGMVCFRRMIGLR